jgi:AcrR family transcriptional regulator
MPRSQPTSRRRYNKVQRAVAEQATRLRIVEALVELHAGIGPARTTVSAVAERAGVERLTVYRHFADERSMLRACSSLYMERNPPPRPTTSAGTTPLTAVRNTLAAVYGWYRANEAMFSNVLRDAETMPAVREAAADLVAYAGLVAADLERLFDGRSLKRKATLHHALEFRTWQSLSRLVRSDRAAAEIASSWIRAGE